MSSLRSEHFLCERNSDSSSADERPKVPPHQPLLQKHIKCDVPDISVVSDAGSETAYLIESELKRKSTEENIPALQNGCKDTRVSTGSSCMSAYKEELLIKCLLSQSEQIQKLQKQVNWLLHKTTELMSLDGSGKEKAVSPHCLDIPSITSNRNTAIFEGYYPKLLEMTNDQSISEKTAVCHQETEVAKQSTSTMTSLTFDNKSEQIQKLQEQVNWLLHRTAEQMSLDASGKERAVSPHFPDTPSIRNPAIFEGPQHKLLEMANKQDNSVKTAMHETEITKQSTSTMTNMTFNGNDKFVIHKKLTVVTDSSKYQKEMSTQCSYAKNGMSSPEQPVSSKRIVSSAKRSGGKPQKSTKFSPKCNCSKQIHNSSGSSDLVSPDDELIQPSPTRNELPLIDTEIQNEQKEEFQNMESKIDKYIPNYENILKNVNDMILENGAEDRSPPPPKKTTPKSTSRSRDKHAKAAKSPTTHKRKEENKELPVRRSSSSNTSINSIQCSPEHRKPRQQRSAPNRGKATYGEEDCFPALRYGLSSPNLSVATKQYLENYGLVQDKSNNRVKSSSKARTSLTKRYPK